MSIASVTKGSLALSEALRAHAGLIRVWVSVRGV